MTVFGTAGSDEGLTLARQHGAHAVFNHKTSGYLDLIRVNPVHIQIMLYTVSNYCCICRKRHMVKVWM